MCARTRGYATATSRTGRVGRGGMGWDGVGWGEMGYPALSSTVVVEPCATNSSAMSYLLWCAAQCNGVQLPQPTTHC
jgi:hypothetical protein